MRSLFYAAAWLVLGLTLLPITLLEPSIIWRGIFIGLTLFCGIACGVNAALLVINNQGNSNHGT
ncbi:hypothetical protein HQN60_00125 [Deefgea piscis]|uniref:Uncharacterized protein n=1 Tax=Deefgea piscis TaxID=2739061 RepID=A0A6M8SKW3_9NEIS|nr:hypothetical protein [Deefgea piscis]QKJ65271.1 hypothetical protein HQN60_00125 [Deefgea piscis]